jgi:hypothetical protein
LFLLSLVMAAYFGKLAWNVISELPNEGYESWALLRAIAIIDWRRGCLTLLFVALAGIWSVVAVRLRRVRLKD